MASSFADPLWAEIRKEYGEHCMRRRDYKKANKNFEASLQHQPNKLDSVYRLTNSQAREANLDNALKLLSEKSELGETQPQNEKLFWKTRFNFQSILSITSTVICRNATATMRKICLKRVCCLWARKRSVIKMKLLRLCMLLTLRWRSSEWRRWKDRNLAHLSSALRWWV